MARNTSELTDAQWGKKRALVRLSMDPSRRPDWPRARDSYRRDPQNRHLDRFGVLLLRHRGLKSRSQATRAAFRHGTRADPRCQDWVAAVHGHNPRRDRALPEQGRQAGWSPPG